MDPNCVVPRSLPYCFWPWTRKVHHVILFQHQVWPFYHLFYCPRFILLLCWVLRVLVTFSTLLDDRRLNSDKVTAPLFGSAPIAALGTEETFRSILISLFSPFSHYSAFYELCLNDYFLKDCHYLLLMDPKGLPLQVSTPILEENHFDYSWVNEWYKYRYQYQDHAPFWLLEATPAKAVL